MSGSIVVSQICRILPQAYKKAASVRTQIEKFDLSRVCDEVIPYGTVMAGNFVGTD
jgi:hypothetical protein